ncbi:MAG: hypothetical protein ACREM1_23090 [Longimicrobiales bacterium]
MIAGVAAALATVGASNDAAAQVQDTVPRPFVEGGIYDKPYLGRLLGRTAVGGYAEAHARWQRADGVTEEAGFVAKRFNLFTATQVSDFVRIGAELEFEDGAEEIKLEFAAIDVAIHPALALRGGMILTPLGRFNLSHDSPLNEFTDRPLVSTELLGVALSEPGLGLLGQFGLGAARLTYEVYGVNGFHEGVIDEAEDGTRLAAGRSNFEDNNASPAFAGRVAFSPRVGWDLGVSAHHGAYNVFEQDGNRVDRRRDVSIFVVDADAEPFGVEVTGEAAWVTIDLPDALGGINASAQRGIYVQAVRTFGRGVVSTMPASYFSLKARVDAVDFDTELSGDDVAQLTVGVNFRPTPDTALKLDFVRGLTRDRLNLRSDFAGILFSIATYF